MSERDKLLGPNRSASGQSSWNWVIASLVLIAVVAVGIAAYFIGRSSGTPTPEVPKEQLASAMPAQPVPQPVAEAPLPAKPAIPAITLSRITDSDMQKIEPGAGCSFSVGDRYYLLTNFDQALIKVGNSATVHNLNDDAGKRLFEGASRVSVGKYLIDIKRRGAEKQLYEGSTVAATLLVTEGESKGELRGIWGCGA